ncbi:MAG: beta-galactosidase, partial [Planctomycetota bacterium]
QPYVPWGTNYYDPNTGWAPKVWQQFDADRVAEQFEIMSGLGVNCARIFLAAAAFQPDVNTVDEEALEKLDAVVKIARRTGVRLILTGPDHWEGKPSYWKPDRFAGEAALKALEKFWTVVGRRYRGEPAIFAWDLLNEPQMPWSLESWDPRWNSWLRSKYQTHETLKTAWGDELGADETLGSVEMPKDSGKRGNPRLLDWQLFREHLADRWVQRQIQVLRQVDPTHLITVGYIQWSYPVIRPGDPSLYAAFNPRRQAQWLDFISIHFYPLMGRPWGSKDNWDRNLAYLQSVLAYCHVGKPVVLGEYGWYGGGAPPGRPLVTEDQQGRWITAEVEASRRLAHGWLSWPFADTPDATDMSVFGGLVRYTYQYKLWALRFRSYAKNLSVLPQPTPELPSFDVTPSLTAPLEDMMAMHQKHAALVQAALKEAGSLPQIELQTKPEPLDETEQEEAGGWRG